MLIKALCDYDDMMKSDDEIVKTPQGYSTVKVNFEILLSPYGEITQIIDKRQERIIKDKNGKEKLFFDPIIVTLPERTQKTSINSNLIEHRPLYIFGLNYEKGEFSPYDKTKKALKSNTIFKKINSDFFKNINSDICRAYYNFLQKWNPDDQVKNDLLAQIGKEYSTSSFIFGLDGNPALMLHNDECFKQKYSEYLSKKELQQNETKEEGSMCSILGEVLPIARIHDKIKGLTGGNSTGCVMVGMKESAFESYGKVQSYNSNISEMAMKKYTNALNMLLSSKSHNQVFDEMTLVYFALKNNDENECSIFSELLIDNAQYDTEQCLSSLYANVKRGIAGNIQSLDIDDNVTFFVVGLVPNSSRISQKFIYKNKFGTIMDNISKHQEDLQVFNNTNQIRFSRIKKELISPKSTNESVPSPLISAIFEAIFTGGNYPEQLLSTVIRRVKTDNDDKNHFIKMNDTRIGIIKACLNRKSRNKNKREEIKMSLDTQNNNQAYLCGRLFAVLEKIQQDSVDGVLNKTIKDTYFSSACSKPSTVFPSLVMLSQNHLKKLKSPVYYNKLVGDIVDGINGEFPTVLSNDDQGKFIIGYYQQNKDLYTAKTTVK